MILLIYNSEKGFDTRIANQIGKNIENIFATQSVIILSRESGIQQF